MTADLIQDIAATAYDRGRFPLRSGGVATSYVDKLAFKSDPLLLRRVLDALVPLIPRDTDVLAGLELGGVPLATGLSLLTGLPVVFVRKAPKTYGTCQAVEGGSVAGRRVCIVEDVVTTGGAVVAGAAHLVAAGGLVEHVRCVVQRDDAATAYLAGCSPPLRLQALCTLAQLEEASYMCTAYWNLTALFVCPHCGAENRDADLQTHFLGEPGSCANTYRLGEPVPELRGVTVTLDAARGESLAGDCAHCGASLDCDAQIEGGCVVRVWPRNERAVTA